MKVKMKGLKRKPVSLRGGPFAHNIVKLYDKANTLFFTVKGQTGRYVNGVWEAA